MSFKVSLKSGTSISDVESCSHFGNTWVGHACEIIALKWDFADCSCRAVLVKSEAMFKN